jgi:FdhD protein
MLFNHDDGALSTVRVAVAKIDGDACHRTEDFLAIEEPLEIRLVYHDAGTRRRQTVSVTMRTPGHDFELASGFLFAEGLIRRRSDIVDVKHCGPAVGEQQLHNVVRVELASELQVDIARLERHSYTSSSCGVCGKTSIAALATASPPPLPVEGAAVDARMLHQLPSALREAQAVFQSTGGLHAAALFATAGQLLSLREDVGRHNALDKLIGAELLADRLPLAEPRVLLLSGRASFELIQKATLAAIPIVAAIGAPSSLAVELAKQYGLTLVGFLRNGRCNIYCGAERIRNRETASAVG